MNETMIAEFEALKARLAAAEAALAEVKAKPARKAGTGTATRYGQVYGLSCGALIRALGAAAAEHGWTVKRVVRLLLANGVVHSGNVAHGFGCGRQWRAGNEKCAEAGKPYGAKPTELGGELLAKMAADEAAYGTTPAPAELTAEQKAALMGEAA